MYDPMETKLSEKWLDKLLQKCEEEDISNKVALLGGWAVQKLVGKEFRKATGREYLKSRDIDIFVDSGAEKEFLDSVKDLGFTPSAYRFRYELIYSREEEEIIPVERSKEYPTYDLIYVFLSVFSQEETEELGSWVFPSLGKAEKVTVGNVPVIDAMHLLELKTESFFEREKTHKQYKDACDAYALLFYSDLDEEELGKEAIELLEYLASHEEYCTFIASHLFGDELKSGLVKRNLKTLI